MPSRNTYTGLASLQAIKNKDSLVFDYGAQIDFSVIGDSSRSTVKTVKLAAAALADATSITVDALDADTAALLTVGTNLYFGQSKEFARVTEQPVEGDTTIAVEALPSALEDNDEATVGGKGERGIPSLTVLCKLANGYYCPRASRPAGETGEAIGFLASPAAEDDPSAALTGYGLIVAGQFYENLLPDADASGNLDSTIRTELLANLLYLQFSDYEDSREV